MLLLIIDDLQAVPHTSVHDHSLLKVAEGLVAVLIHM